MNCAPAACGKPYIDSAGLVQKHLIIARRSLLVGVGERRRKVRTGIDQDVAPVIATRAAEMGVGKAVDYFVRVMVPAAAIPVPGIGAGVRAQLNHSKRIHGTRKGVAVGVRSHKRIHIGNQCGEYGYK